MEKKNSNDILMVIQDKDRVILFKVFDNSKNIFSELR